MLKNKNLIYKKVTNTLYLNWWMFLADSHQHFKEKIVICCVEWLTSCAFFVSQPRQPTIMGAAVLGYGCTSAVPPVSHVLLSVGSFWPGWQAFASSWRKTPGCSPNSYSLAASTHTRTASMEAKRSEAINTSAEFPQLLFHLQHFFLLLVFYFSSFYFFLSLSSYCSLVFLHSAKMSSFWLWRPSHPPLSRPLPLTFFLFHPSFLALCQNAFIAVCSQWVAVYT